jgi:hypothetical protein
VIPDVGLSRPDRGPPQLFVVSDVLVHGAWRNAPWGVLSRHRDAPRSPRGFVLDARFPQLLLPDGRLWYYHSRLSPEGVYYDAAVDHARSSHGSIPVAGQRFSFLGAVIRPYHFGYLSDSSDYKLGAIVATSAGYVASSQALADIDSRFPGTGGRIRPSR